MSTARAVLQSIYYRLMEPLWRRSFAPRIVDVEMDRSSFRFYVGSLQASNWYDPPKPHTMTEYSWVLQNIEFAGKEVLDVGAHHGHYSLVFAMSQPPPSRLVAVEPSPANTALIEVNAALNRAQIEIRRAAVSASRGKSRILSRSNSRIFGGGGVEVDTFTLSEILPSASVVKLDIEGMEFDILPDEIDRMPSTQSWIVEVHPAYGDPNRLASEFLSRDFRGDFVDRDSSTVVSYDLSSSVTSATTFFFRRR